MRSFTNVWITGSTNFKVSNVVEHATSEIHKAAMAQKKASMIHARGGSVVLSTDIPFVYLAFLLPSIQLC